MGIPFASTFIYRYLLIQSNSNGKQIKLAGKNIIIDGNSFMRYIYKEIVKEDKSKPQLQRLTDTPFGYNGFSQRCYHILYSLNEVCSSVTVVFDGIVKANPYERPEPDRSMSLRFPANNMQEEFPFLLRHELLCILWKLKIKTIEALGEADPLIVRMAENEQAYIVAHDSDYHLYKLSNGFVPLQFLDLKTLVGRSFQMNDIFKDIDQLGVALWATVIANEFITFKQVQTLCPINSISDQKKFRQWLEQERADDEKSQWTTTQFCLLRFIQKVHTKVAYEHLIKDVSSDDRPQFDRIMNNYINILEDLPFKTQNGTQLPDIIHERFMQGIFDRRLIDLLIYGELPSSDSNILHFNLLLQIYLVLLKWNYLNDKSTDLDKKITYQGQEYDLSEIVLNDNVCLLDDIFNLPENDQGNYVLHCINHALGFEGIIIGEEVHEEYLLWLALLKLWFHKTENRTSPKEAILYGLIVSFLKHILLDIYDDEYENDQSDETEKLLIAPFLQYSSRELKQQISMGECAFLREKIQRRSETLLSKEPILLALHEIEQLYDHLDMINQFFNYPLFIPAPHKCINQLAYRSAVVFADSKNVSREIKISFGEQKFFVDMVEEIRDFISPRH